MTTTTDSAASQLAVLLPSQTPLTARPAGIADRPVEGARAWRASYVGAEGLDIVLAVAPDVLEALSGLDRATVADALASVIEGAVRDSGPGVLGPVEEMPIEQITPGDSDAYVLEAEGAPHAWFWARRHHGPTQAPSAPLPAGSMKVLYDVELSLTVEIGRTRLLMRDVMNLVPGAVLELDRSAGSPADILVNGRIIARGEVVVVDEDYAVRVTEILSPEGEDAP